MENWQWSWKKKRINQSPSASPSFLPACSLELPDLYSVHFCVGWCIVEFTTWMGGILSGVWSFFMALWKKLTLWQNHWPTSLKTFYSLSCKNDVFLGCEFIFQLLIVGCNQNYLRYKRYLAKSVQKSLKIEFVAWFHWWTNWAFQNSRTWRSGAAVPLWSWRGQSRTIWFSQAWFGKKSQQKTAALNQICCLQLDNKINHMQKCDTLICTGIFSIYTGFVC